MKTKIVWNGCDSYIELDQAESHGYDVVGDKLYHKAEEFTAFEVEEISPETFLEDEDLSGIFGTETGSFYSNRPEFCYAK